MKIFFLAVSLWLFTGGKQLFAQQCSDPAASPRTVSLYQNLFKVVANKKAIFGHQDDLAYGIGWKYEKGRSDVKSVTGDYPGLYGWELGHIELDSSANLDQVPFKKMRQFIRQGYRNGAALTISWHCTNPLTGKSAWDAAPGTVSSVLQGGKNFQLFNGYLDRLAAFLSSLKDPAGRHIPIIFRPYHELLGGWFWWGKGSCSAEEFKALYRYTVKYLRVEKHLHNLLFVYNPTGNFSTAEDYLERYPGDDVVDIMSLDEYQGRKDETAQHFISRMEPRLLLMDSIAKVHGKLAALAETGMETIPVANWWTSVFARLLINTHMAYGLVWRNGGKVDNTSQEAYFAPYPGQQSEADFKEMFKKGDILFAKSVQQLHLYKKK